MKKYNLFLLAVSLLILIFLSSSCGPALVSIFKYFERTKAGLVQRSIHMEDHDIAYLEGGKGETIILLHGFGQDKDSWTRFAKFLTEDHHVIIPDLPGFGESSSFMDKHYDIETQVERIQSFVNGLKIKKFHISGNSMGGYIAGMYAAAHPDRVLSLGLFGSAGVKSPSESEYYRLKREGHNPLVANDMAGFDRLMSFVFIEPPELPDSVKSYMAEQSVMRNGINSKILKEIVDTFLLENKLGQIQSRTLILWGDSDRIEDVSGATVFEKGIKNSTVVIIENCGHLCMVERPEDTSEEYRKFIAR